MKERKESQDHNELLLQVNYLSPVLLDLLLLQHRQQQKSSDKKDLRLVHLSTGFHRNGKLNFDDLQLKSGYENMKAYCQAKLALTTFSNMLQRVYEQGSADTSLSFVHELKGQGVGLRSVAVDPGMFTVEYIIDGVHSLLIVT